MTRRRARTRWGQLGAGGVTLMGVGARVVLDTGRRRMLLLRVGPRVWHDTAWARHDDDGGCAAVARRRDGARDSSTTRALAGTRLSVGQDSEDERRSGLRRGFVRGGEPSSRARGHMGEREWMGTWPLAMGLGAQREARRVCSAGARGARQLGHDRARGAAGQALGRCAHQVRLSRRARATSGARPGVNRRDERGLQRGELRHGEDTPRRV